jgi:hypothetical protein
VDGFPQTPANLVFLEENLACFFYCFQSLGREHWKNSMPDSYRQETRLDVAELRMTGN